MIIQIPTFILALICYSAVIRLIQINRQVKSSLCPGKKDMNSLGFEPLTYWSYTWHIRPQDQDAPRQWKYFVCKMGNNAR